MIFIFYCYLPTFPIQLRELEFNAKVSTYENNAILVIKGRRKRRESEGERAKGDKPGGQTNDGCNSKMSNSNGADRISNVNEIRPKKSISANIIP